MSDAWGEDVVHLKLPFDGRLDPQSETGKAIADAARGKGKKRKSKEKDEPKPPAIPKAPGTAIEPLTGDEIKRGISQRARSAANLKVEGYSYQDIADLLEFDKAADAKRAVESVLAAIHGPGDYETIRIIAAARAEDALRRSTQMAKANFIQMEDGDRVPNTEQLRWHQQAGTDLMNWAVITGAKAPTKVEITPGDDDMERLVALMLERSGHEEIVDAEVIDLEYIPNEPVDDLGEDDDAT